LASEACALTACEFESRHRRLQRFLDSRTAAKDEIDRIAADFIGEHPLVGVVKEDQVRTLADLDGASVRESEKRGSIDRAGCDCLLGCESAAPHGEGEGERHGMSWGRVGVTVGGKRQSTALVDEEAGPGEAPVRVEARAGQDDAEGWGSGKGRQIGL